MIKKNKTQFMISSAYFLLLQEKKDCDISICEICKKAQVARKTFYNNFSSKENIIEFSMNFFFDNWEPLTEKTLSMTEIYRSAFDFVDKNRDLFNLLYRRDMFKLVESKMTEYCRKKWPYGAIPYPVDEKYLDYYISSSIASFVNILKMWIKRNFTDPIDDLVALTDMLILAED